MTLRPGQVVKLTRKRNKMLKRLFNLVAIIVVVVIVYQIYSYNYPSRPDFSDGYAVTRYCNYLHSKSASSLSLNEMKDLSDESEGRGFCWAFSK